MFFRTGCGMLKFSIYNEKIWEFDQAFSRLIVAAILVLQILRELGQGGRRGGERESQIPTPLVALSILPNLALLLKSKMAASISLAQKNTPVL